MVRPSLLNGSPIDSSFPENHLSSLLKGDMRQDDRCTDMSNNQGTLVPSGESRDRVGEVSAQERGKVLTRG